MLKVMIQYYEITKKEEIIEFIENYLKYLKTAIEDRHLTGWTQARTGDVLYVICLLYTSRYRLSLSAPLTMIQ